MPEMLKMQPLLKDLKIKGLAKIMGLARES
jgi:hypothetical protein